jgi:hypothetical protein
MSLVLTVPSGPVGAVVELQTPGGSVKCPVASLTSGTSIANGTYDGQPVKWNGSAYVPLALGDSLVLQSVHSPAFLAIDGQVVTLQSTAGDLDLLSSASISAGAPDILMSGTNSVQLVAPSVNLVGTSSQILLDCVQTIVQADATSRLLVASGNIGVLCDNIALQDALGVNLVTLSAAGIRINGAALGFFDAGPVARPTITGATTQLQVDSLVSALVALGLVVDGR